MSPSLQEKEGREWMEERQVARRLDCHQTQAAEPNPKKPKAECGERDGLAFPPAWKLSIGS